MTPAESTHRPRQTAGRSEDGSVHPPTTANDNSYVSRPQAADIDRHHAHRHDRHLPLPDPLFKTHRRLRIEELLAPLERRDHHISRSERDPSGQTLYRTPGLDARHQRHEPYPTHRAQIASPSSSRQNSHLLSPPPLLPVPESPSQRLTKAPSGHSTRLPEPDWR